MEIKHEVKGNMNAAYDVLSKLVSQVVDCTDDGLVLKVEFVGTKKAPTPVMPPLMKYSPLDRIGEKSAAEF